MIQLVHVISYVILDGTKGDGDLVLWEVKRPFGLGFQSERY